MKKKESLYAVLARHKVALAYLFGSQIDAGLSMLEGASVNMDDPLTDLDLGVTFIDGLPQAGKRAFLYSQLYNELCDLFAPYTLDLTFLQENHSVFQANAISGICIYAASPVLQDEYEERVLTLAADFKPFLDKYLEEYLEEVVGDD
jgi:uncharacterized protein